MVAEASRTVQEMRDFARAFSAGFIFSVPLLYTAETWEIGVTASDRKLLLLFLLGMGITIVLTYYSGFRDDVNVREVFEDAIEVTAIGTVAAAVALLVLGRISVGDPVDDTVGRIVLQAVPLGIGAAVANSIFGRTEADTSDSTAGDVCDDVSGWFRELINDGAATFIGSVFLIFGIAPTDEVRILASEIGPVHILAVALLSLFVSFGIVFASGYDRSPGTGPFHDPISETVLAYVISLGVAAASLVVFDRIQSSMSLEIVIGMIVVLGLPATVGGAAGRLVI